MPYENNVWHPLFKKIFVSLLQLNLKTGYTSKIKDTTLCLERVVSFILDVYPVFKFNCSRETNIFLKSGCHYTSKIKDTTLSKQYFHIKITTCWYKDKIQR
jgi:hypothetical protein